MKQYADETLNRLKASLVIRDGIMKKGIHFNETFSTVIKMTTIKCLLAIAAKKNCEISQFDVNNAFSLRDLREEVNMKLSSVDTPKAILV